MGHGMVKSLIATNLLMNRLILMGDDLMEYGKRRLLKMVASCKIDYDYKGFNI